LMKARVIKPKKLEKQKKHYLDLFNELVWNRSKNNSSLKNLKSFESVNNDATSVGLGLSVATMTGGLIQQYGIK